VRSIAFLVGPSHSFEQFAAAIDAAFARWDLSHLHTFELSDGRQIGYPDDSFGPELEWLDHAKLKVAKEVKAAEVFEYVFDLGDSWQHRCVVGPEKADPIDEYGIVPELPVVIWGWGSIPDQYGRRSFDDDGED
jgi:hypothetical protein